MFIMSIIIGFCGGSLWVFFVVWACKYYSYPVRIHFQESGDRPDIDKNIFALYELLVPDRRYY